MVSTLTVQPVICGSNLQVHALRPEGLHGPLHVCAAGLACAHDARPPMLALLHMLLQGQLLPVLWLDRIHSTPDGPCQHGLRAAASSPPAPLSYQEPAARVQAS